jgi:glycosyltransferase involved in cell wall biosynthesis
MARVSILTPTLIRSDAVGNDVLGMYEVLTQRNHEVHLFAEDSSVTDCEVQDVEKAAAYCDRADDILIYHHSIGWEMGADILQRSRGRVVIKYHNVTPARFFEGISVHHQELCELGREQLSRIATDEYAAYLAASDYNMHELLDAGAPAARTFVMRPFNQIDQLAAVVPALDILDRYRDGRTNLLMVGSVRPNKGHASLIEAFAQYYYDFNCHSRLIIVGAEDPSLASYSAHLRNVAELLQVDQAIVFTGQVPLEALKAYYLLSDVFVIASEHEGFCVPLVEAMASKVPIAGYSSAAIGETVHDCGILWEDRDPVLLGESIAMLTQDDVVSTGLAQEAYHRYEQLFSNDVVEDQFLESMRAVGLNL